MHFYYFFSYTSELKTVCIVVAPFRLHLCSTGDWDKYIPVLSAMTQFGENRQNPGGKCNADSGSPGGAIFAVTVLVIAAEGSHSQNPVSKHCNGKRKDN